MNDHGHFICYCSKCEKVISQCRCMSKDKEVRYEVCDDCKEKKAKNQHGMDWWNDFGSSEGD